MVDPRPASILLFLGVVAAGVGALWWRMPSRGMALTVGPLPSGSPRGWGARIGTLPPLLRMLALAALTWSLATPYRTVPAPVPPGEGVGVVVALDLSQSMEEPGLGGARKMDVALDELRRFLDARAGDAVGLVVFAGEALVRVPPTVDRAPLRRALDALRPGDLGEGTAVGTALGLAANRLRGLDVRSRAIVLITDGRSNAGSLDPVTAARAAAGVGQRVYVVEVVGAGDGEPALEAVAQAGNGRHFPVTEGADLTEAYREIDALEPSRLPGTPSTARIPASPWLLWAVVAALVTERILRASRWGRIP